MVMAVKMCTFFVCTPMSTFQGKFCQSRVGSIHLCTVSWAIFLPSVLITQENSIIILSMALGSHQDIRATPFDLLWQFVISYFQVSLLKVSLFAEASNCNRLPTIVTFVCNTIIRLIPKLDEKKKNLWFTMVPWDLAMGLLWCPSMGLRTWLSSSNPNH